MEQREEEQKQNKSFPSSKEKYNNSPQSEICMITLNLGVGIFIASIFLIFALMEKLHNGDECSILRFWSLALAIFTLIGVSYRLCLAIPMTLRKNNNERSTWNKYVKPSIEGVDIVITLALTLILAIALTFRENCGGLRIVVICYVCYSFLLVCLVIGGIIKQFYEPTDEVIETSSGKEQL